MQSSLQWIHIFDNVDAVIFVASIGDYDRNLFEDVKVNRLEETFNLFRDTCKLEAFANKPFIVMLNKSDLFSQKIKTLDLKEACPSSCSDYDGGCNEEIALNYIKSKFKAIYDEGGGESHERELHQFASTATNTENFLTVFNQTKSIILRRNLIQSGFIQ